MQKAIDEPHTFEETAREAKEIVFGQLDLDKPLICRLNGHATGLGASLALLSDIVIAAEPPRSAIRTSRSGSSPATAAR